MMRGSIYTALILLMSAFCSSKGIHKHEPINNYYDLYDEYFDESFDEYDDDLDEYFYRENEPWNVPNSFEKVLNEVSDADDFHRVFNIPDEDNEPAMASDWAAAAPHPRKLPSDHNQDVQYANCVPENVTVELKMPKKRKMTYVPTCVRLPRCGGCCARAKKSCQPTREEQVDIKVYMTPTNQLKRRRRRGTNENRLDIDYAIIKETKHLECGCQCVTKPEDCDAQIHRYDNARCSCMCKDGERKRQCQGKRGSHYWNKNKCQCMCREDYLCSSEEYFNHEYCRCFSL